MQRSRRTYTDRDRAAVYAELTVNGGNLTRTSRNLNVPKTTVKRWKLEWEKEGVPEEVQVALLPVVTDFVAEAKRVRDKLLMKFEEMVDDGKATPSAVITGLGILTDKIRAYENIPTSKVEHQIKLPPADELRDLFLGAVDGVVEAATQRAADIKVIEAEPVRTSYVELLPGTDYQED